MRGSPREDRGRHSKDYTPKNPVDPEMQKIDEQTRPPHSFSRQFPPRHPSPSSPALKLRRGERDLGCCRRLGMPPSFPPPIQDENEMMMPRPNLTPSFLFPAPIFSAGTSFVLFGLMQRAQEGEKEGKESPGGEKVRGEKNAFFLFYSWPFPVVG